MMRLLFLTSAMLVCVASSVARAQGPYTGPWDSAADAAAEKAVARLGASRGLEIRGTVLTIPSLVRLQRLESLNERFDQLDSPIEPQSAPSSTGRKLPRVRIETVKNRMSRN